MKCREVLVLVISTAACVQLAVATENWETVFPGGGTTCANGEEYRFHVRHAAKDRAMVFFNGGGACWNAQMCDPTNSSNDMNDGMIYRVRPTADYGNHPRVYGGAFDLENEENPFLEWTQIFVTYCTADVHLGDRETDYLKDDGTRITMRHRGRRNGMAVVNHVHDTYPDLQRILVSGGSAGGVAAPFYAAEFASRYPRAEILHLSGGSSGYRFPFSQTGLWDSWGVFQDPPDWLDVERYHDGNTRFIDLYFAAAEAFPGIRFHTYDSAYDSVQELFVRLMGGDSLLYEPLNHNQQELGQILPHYRSYTTRGDFHTLLRFDELYAREVEGVRARDWVAAIIEGKDVDTISCGNSARCR